MRATGAGARCARRAGTDSGTGLAGNHGLARANGSAVDGLAGSRRGGRLGQTGPGHRGLRGHGRPRCSELSNQIGARRNHGARGGLAGERTPLRGRWGGSNGSRRSGSFRTWRAGLSGRTRRSRHGAGGRGANALGRCGGKWGSRAGKNLSGFRRGGRHGREGLGRGRRRPSRRDDRDGWSGGGLGRSGHGRCRRGRSRRRRGDNRGRRRFRPEWRDGRRMSGNGRMERSARQGRADGQAAGNGPRFLGGGRLSGLRGSVRLGFFDAEVGACGLARAFFGGRRVRLGLTGGRRLGGLFGDHVGHVETVEAAQLDGHVLID